MAGFVKGDILKIKFPFTDLSQIVKRPSFVVKQVSSNDIIFCPITSTAGHPDTSIEIDGKDFDSGSIPHISYIRIDKPFTGNISIVEEKLGKLKGKKTTEVLDKLSKFIRN